MEGLLLIIVGCLACGAGALALALRTAGLELHGPVRQRLLVYAGSIVLASGAVGYCLGRLQYAEQGGVGGIILVVLYALAANLLLSLCLLTPLVQDATGVKRATASRAALFSGLYLVPMLALLLFVGALSAYPAWWARVLPVIAALGVLCLLLARPWRQARSAA